MNKPIEINEDCQFMKDLDGNQRIALFNLATSLGAVKLWTKGIKPNRHWRFNQVKEYFGMNGNAEKFLGKLETLNNIIKEK